MGSNQDYQMTEQPPTSGSNAGTAILAVIVIMVIILATWYIYQGELGGTDDDEVQITYYYHNITVDKNETFNISSADYTPALDRMSTNSTLTANSLGLDGYNSTTGNWTFTTNYVEADYVLYFETDVGTNDLLVYVIKVTVN